MSGMDYDRRSAVSSFYGGRKSSLDALNADFPSSPPPQQFGQPQRARMDSASSFYNANRNSLASADVLGGAQTAGYNPSSFFHPGREEPLKGGHDEEQSMLSNNDPGWDVYADFNNQGPRYSTAFVHRDTGYRQVPSPSPLKMEEESGPSGPVEMVTVPALGPEWKASELATAKKKAKREDRFDSFALKWKAWNRGETGLCGPYFTRRFTAIFFFAFCIALGITLAFVIPRVPSFAFNTDHPLINATAPFNESVPVEFNRSPANFSFPAFGDIVLDTNSNYLPLVISKMQATVYDLTTGRQVGVGNLGKKSYPAKSFPTVQLPLNFSYVGVNDTDVTWADFYNACRNPAANANDTRPPLQFNLELDMWILGLVGKKSTSATVTEAPCPITLSLNAA
ncbi:hypothetical protein AcW1_007125 [Taiwanofungus camphoratus]|nr:hypothetical protein AcV7_005034 [Antrodia cinnamomea]KAI0952716.1 hypothetical protein AcW1_007125 [Antrodia cinnamomea]